MKTPVIIRKDYVVAYENHEGHTFIHCDCLNWSKTVYRQLVKDTDTLISLHDAPIYAMHEIGDEKHLKFLNRAKFTYRTNIMCTDGIERQIFERAV